MNLARPTGRTSADRMAQIVFGVALLVSAGLLLHYRLRIGLAADDLIFLKDRGQGGIDVLLEPHNGNIVVLQAALYRLFFVLFGIDSSAPLQVVSLFAFLLSIVAFFVWCRPLVGDWAAALVSIPLLFLGTAYHDLLWAFQIGYSVSILGGLTALIALDRDGRWSHPIACLALVVAVTTSSMGLPFLVGVAVLLWCREGWRGILGYTILVPLGFYLVWFAGWGSTAQSTLSLENLIHAPVFVAESVKSVVMGLTGLHRVSSGVGDAIGWAITAGAVGLTALSLVRRRALPRSFLVALAIGLTFWVLASLSQDDGGLTRSPDQSRYQLPGAIFVLMMLAGAFSGRRPGFKSLVALSVVAVISVICSLATLSEGQRGLSYVADVPKASMTALDIAGTSAVPPHELSLVPFFPEMMSQAQFRELEGRYGRAGWTADQIDDQSDDIRSHIDAELVAFLGMSIVEDSKAPGGACRVRRPVSGRITVESNAGRVGFTSRRPLTVSVGRFASGSPVPVGEVPAGRQGTLVIPRDSSRVPWRVTAIGNTPIKVCVSRKG